MSTGSGAIPCVAAPTACAIRPQFGSPPYMAVLTKGESATARATALAVGSCPPRTITRPTRRGAPPAPPPPRARAARGRGPRLAEVQLVGALRLDRDARLPAALQDHGVAGRQLAVDADPLERS